MKILKEGDPGRLENSRRFECPACGCVFVANEGEYRWGKDPRNEEAMICECSTCGRRVYRYD